MVQSADQVVVCALKPSFEADQNFFSIFGLEPAFAVDIEQLSTHYRQLQQQIHPDRFMRECDRSQRLAQQQATQVNAAYNTLKNPLLRAQYLMQLVGLQRPAERTLRDHDFLMEQMILRERLDEAASDVAALDDLQVDIRGAVSRHENAFAQAWSHQDVDAAQLAIDKLQFANKLLQEIDDRQEQLLDR